MVGIFIANLNNVGLTKKCIESLSIQSNQEFKIYLYDQNSNEIGTTEFLDECESNGIIVIRNKVNVYLNHLWSEFKNVCDCEYLCFLNNDVILTNTFIRDTINVLNNEPNVGITIHITNNPEHLQAKNTIEYKIFTKPTICQGWDFTIRRNIMPDIPKELQIFGGDDYVFAKVGQNGYNVAVLYSSPIIHFKEMTRQLISNIKEIQDNDGIEYLKLMKNENLEHLISTLGIGISKVVPEPNMKLINYVMKDLFYCNDFNYYLNRIKNDKHFKYARYNDGELIAIAGNNPNESNCDGHQYFPEMSNELKKCLLNYDYSEDYVLESFDYWYNVSPNTKQILDELKSENLDLSFLRTDFIRIAHEQTPDKFLELIEVLKTKKLVIIGPDYLTELRKFLNFIHIQIPTINCYLVKDDVIKAITDINNNNTDVYYLFSASMPTKIIIDAFKNDNKNTYIDWGSVWDTFFVSNKYGFIRKRSTSNHEKYREIYKDFLI